MQAKKVLSCGFAFLLVLAFAGVSSALDVADVRGTWVRIEKPADDAYAAIGDTVIVAVHTVSKATGIAVQLVEPDGEVDEDTAPDPVVGEGYNIDISGNDLLTADDTREDGGTAVTLPDDDDDDGAKIVRFFFIVGVTDEEVQKNGLFVQVTLTGSGSEAGVISNLTEDEQILPGATGFSTTPIGDGNTFGIDNRRPIHSDELFKQFDLVDANVKSDKKKIQGAMAPANVEDIATSSPLSMIKEGDNVTVTLRLDRGALIAANATVASVIFVKETLLDADDAPSLVTGGTEGLMDSSIAVAKFANLYASGTLEQTLDTSEGVFGDGQRVRSFAFLQDEAGNLGGSRDNDPAASGYDGSYTFTTDDNNTPDTNDDTTEERVNLFMIDTTTPSVTVAYPKAGTTDSIHMSAKTVQDLDYYSDSDGTLGPVKHSRLLRPLTLTVSEDVDSIKVTHGDSTATIPRTESDDDTKEFTVNLTESNIAAGYKPTKGPASSPGDSVTAGTKGKLTIVAYDLVGNGPDSARVLADIIFDGNDPRIYSLFPTADNAPKDDNGRRTITKNTVDPLFSLSEDLDSLAVRYVQKGASPPDLARGSFSSGTTLGYNDGKLRQPVLQDTLLDGEDYYLQLVAVDLAGNASVTSPSELRFKDEFMNPTADSFVVATAVDDQEAVVVGAAFSLNLTALDSQLTSEEGENVRAVVYRGSSQVRLEVSEDQADRLEGVTFEGDNVEIAPADTGLGIATLDGDGWKAGARSVTIKSEMTLTGVMVVVEDLDEQGAVAFSTSLGPFSFDRAEFAQFTVVALDDGEGTESVIGEFQLSVTPTDKFGNPSMKRTNTIDSKLDIDDFENDDGLYKTVAIEFSSTNSQVSVPAGRQEIEAGANIFDANAGEGSGNVVIGVFSDEPEDVTSSGSVKLSFGPEPVEVPGAPGAPASLIVEDYKGPSGEGDQGGMVMVSFPNSADHATVDKYQIFRELSVTTALDSAGNLMTVDEATMAWVPWADLRLEDPNADVQRAVIPALDNVATKWAVAAVGVGGSSDRTSAAEKRVFSKESVQQTLELLGMAPEAVLTDDELMNQFNAPEDYVKSILGDQKNLVFAPVNPDVSALLGNGSVPSNIRTDAHNLLASDRTATEETAGAIDDIAPSAATDESGAVKSDGDAAQVALSWTVSADDGRIVGYIPYRGHSVPIYGLKGYKVLRGASEDALESIGTVSVGSTEFVDMNLPEDLRNLRYRIDAFDDNNDTPGQLVTIQNLAVRAKFVDANGDPVFLTVLPPVGDLEVNFEDFLAFAAAFNSQKGDENYNVQADVNDDGMVDFSDFVTAAGSFGRTAAAPANKLAVVPQRPGLNADTEMRLELASEKVVVGETISVTVSMANAKALNGYGLELVYDADKFEFVSAVPAENDLLKSQGGETPLFKNWPEEGRVSVVNAIVESGSVSGEGALVTFTFKVLREFDDNARFEIAQGVVFDADQLQNPVVSLGALDVQSTPTEFALHQNYPNPFNPQTNIPYDLAESGDVVLRIYNLLGQEVRTLVRDRQQAGRYTIQWSGMDDRGVSISSGIYFYQVSVAGKFQDAKRLMLLK